MKKTKIWSKGRSGAALSVREDGMDVRSAFLMAAMLMVPFGASAQDYYIANASSPYSGGESGSPDLPAQRCLAWGDWYRQYFPGWYAEGQALEEVTDQGEVAYWRCGINSAPAHYEHPTVRQTEIFATYSCNANSSADVEFRRKLIQ